MNIDFEAREELLAAAIWYEEQRPGLGDQLLAAVNETLERIDAQPKAFPADPFDPRAMRAQVERFPYVVVFVVHADGVRVVAFAHARRRPFYWRDRT